MEKNTYLFETSGFSMWPFLKQGEKLVFKHLGLEELMAGDIILFRFRDGIVCHRLVKISKKNGKYLLYLKGDNTAGPCEILGQDCYLGKAVGIIKNNRIIGLTGPKNKLFNRIIVAIAPFTYRITSLAKILYRKIKKLWGD